MITCKLCDLPTYNPDGSTIGTIWVYQRIDGTIRKARQLVLHVPLIQIHDNCLKELLHE